MRDYIAWYLIELRRRLTNVDPQGRVEDFLLETRTHLSESIDDMTSRGITEEAATKSAIADFGHPSLVAQAFRGKRQMSSRAYWILVGLLVVCLVPVIVQIVSSSTDNALGYMNGARFDFGVTSCLLFAAVALLAFFSRRWCAIPVIGAAVLMTVIVGGWHVNKTQPYALGNGSGKFVLLSDKSAANQVEVRDEWVKEFDRILPVFENALHPPMMVGENTFLLELIDRGSGRFIAPHDGGSRNYSVYWSGAPELPSNEHLWSVRSSSPRWIGLEDARAQRYYLVELDNKLDALAAWQEHGSDYLQQLHAQKAVVLREAGAFKAPVTVASDAIVSRLLWLPVGVVLAFSLIGMLINGASILASDVTTALGRRRWKRMLN